MCLVMSESGSDICAAVGGGSLTSLLIVLAQGDGLSESQWGSFFFIIIKSFEIGEDMDLTSVYLCKRHLCAISKGASQ